jgi:hypothetical protein
MLTHPLVKYNQLIARLTSEKLTSAQNLHMMMSVAIEI